MYQDFSLKDYIDSLYKNEELSSRTFYRDNEGEKTYKNLIQKSFILSKNLSSFSDQYIILQLESSYLLFAYLIAGLISKKKFLIISSKEPLNSVMGHKNHFPFTRIIKDGDAPDLDDLAQNFPEVDGKHTLFNILSSGSTGPAKSIPLTLENVYESSKSIISFFGMNSTHATLLNLPHNHIGGLMILWRSFFSSGLVTTKNSDHYDFISLVPLQLRRKLSDQDEIEKLSQCKAVLVGGAPFDLELKKLALSHNISTYETYGMSETSSLVMLNGTPLEGQIIELDSNDHFLIKGPTLSPILPRDARGFYHTKDVGKKNPDGSYSFLYRSDLLFKSAGEMIDPMKIEAVVKNYPGIKNAVVTNVPHPEWTHASALVYQADGNITEEDLKSYLKKELHPHLVPKLYFEAPGDLINNEMKPKRFLIKEFAVKKSLEEKLYFSHIQHPTAKNLMVYFHGFMEDHSDMTPLKLDDADFSHLFIDLPGHGRTTFNSFKDREDFLFTIETLIKTVGHLQKIYFYGYSQGGRVAIELIKRGINPALTILESSSFGISSQNEKEIRLKSDLRLFNDFSTHQNFFLSWYKNPIFGNYQNYADYEIEIEKKSKHDFHEWQASLKFLSPGAGPYLLKDNIEALSNLPVVGIFGSMDEKYKSHFLEVKKILPNLLLKEIPGAAHNPHKTHLNVVRSIMKESLDLFKT